MTSLQLTPPDRGLLLVVSGPSGVGKSTLLRHVLDTVPGIAFSVSATTRGPRKGEVDGVQYHFVDDARFAALVEEDAFLEYASVYGRSYGTLRQPTEDILASGRSVLLDIDVQGAQQVSGRTKDAVTVFILPPDRATVEARLRARSTDDEATIQRRLADMDAQIAGIGSYDYLLVNDDLATAKATLQGIVAAELSRRPRRESLIRKWLGTEAL
jgi:guanylate kinase